MEMVGALVGLVGAGLQAQAQANQLGYEYSNLAYQKSRAAQQDWMSQAGRTDMYGNTTRYDPALNKWVVDLSPDQQQIRDAQQREQLLALTKDAPAARKIKQAIQQRAYEAKEPFNKAQLGYQYDQPPSEEATRSQLYGLMANNDMLRSKADQALIMRSAARMGTGARAADIINETNQQLGSAPTMQNRMLEARKQALAEHGTRMQQHEAQYGTPMKVWGELMQAGGDMPNISRGNLDQSINSMISGQSSGMENAFNRGSTGVSSAMTALATAAGKSPDLSDVAKILAKAKFGSKDGDSYDMSGTGGGSSTFGDYENDAGYDKPSSSF